MQTKKRILGKNFPQEHASPRISRALKKVSEDAQVSEKDTELIASSVRKQKSGINFLKKNRESVAATNLNTRHISLPSEESSPVCLENDSIHNASATCKEGYNMGTENVSETLFSPAFHASKSVGVDFSKFFHCGDQRISHYAEIDNLQNSEFINGRAIALLNTVNSGNLELDTRMSSTDVDLPNCGSPFDEDLGANLRTDVSAIYLAVKNSKLECVDEHGQGSMLTDICVEEDDNEDFDDFDPYLFIKNLPKLSSVVPSFRPMLLPKQTRSCPSISLVLDLDETLVHSTLEPCDDADFSFPVSFNLVDHTVYVRCRPHLQDFMEQVASLFEIIVFTASQGLYAEQLLNALDPKRRIFRHRVFRDSCVFVEGNYLKDLSVLGRDLSRVAIIDNSPQAFGFQIDNGIPIESWFDDGSDQELLLLLPFLESLVGAEDVRPLIAKEFNLRERVEGASYHAGDC